MERIVIKYFDKSLPKLELIEGKSDWIDLRAKCNVFIQEQSSDYIPLNVAMKLPSGYEAHIVPRSSSFKRWGILQTNHMGIIDETYCGDNDEWLMPVYIPRGYGKDVRNGKKGTLIRKGDRVCQFRIMKKQPTIVFEETDALSDTDRGGFGSTGAN